MTQRRQTWSWAMYDWANSAFATTVMAGFFPLFFKLYWSQGVEVTQTTYYLGVGNSIASLVVVILAPILGAMADTGALRKRMLAAFACLGVLATGALYLVEAGMWPFAILLYAIAVVGFSGANTFYDALLVIISAVSTRHRVSALGFALGYLGGGLLFLVNVLMYLFPHRFGLTDGTEAIRWSFVTVTLWWAVFSIPIFLWVDEPVPASGRRRVDFPGTFAALAQTARNLRHYRGAWLFLLAYWLYIDGVDTIIVMAGDFGMKLGLPSDSLIKALLLVQFIGFPAAIIFGRVGERLGTRNALLVALAVYIGVTIWAYTLETEAQFYAMAAAIGCVQGGIQSLSRAYYSRLIPAAQAGTFFGIYNMLGKFAAVLGPLVVGVTAQVSGNPRLAILSLLVFFVAGGILLIRADQLSRVSSGSALPKA